MAARAKSKVLEVHRLGAASVAGRWAVCLMAKRSPAGEGWALGSKVWSGSEKADRGAKLPGDAVTVCDPVNVDGALP